MLVFEQIVDLVRGDRLSVELELEAVEEDAWLVSASIARDQVRIVIGLRRVEQRLELAK